MRSMGIPSRVVAHAAGAAGAAAGAGGGAAAAGAGSSPSDSTSYTPAKSYSSFAAGKFPIPASLTMDSLIFWAEVQMARFIRSTVICFDFSDPWAPCDFRCFLGAPVRLALWLFFGADVDFAAVPAARSFL